MNTDMDEHSSNAAGRSSFAGMLVAGVNAVAMHPAVVAGYMAAMLALIFSGSGLQTVLGGAQPEPDAGREIILRYVAAGLAIQIVFVPFHSILDAFILSAARLACRNERVRAGPVMEGIHRYVVRMFLMNVVSIAVILVCPTRVLVLVAAFYLRFLTVYIVHEDVSVREAFRKGTSIMFNRDSWFMQLYLLATLCSAMIMIGMQEGAGGSFGTSIKVLGTVILVYVDLVVICTSFMLFSRVRKVEQGQ